MFIKSQITVKFKHFISKSISSHVDIIGKDHEDTKNVVGFS